MKVIAFNGNARKEGDEEGLSACTSHAQTLMGSCR